MVKLVPGMESTIVEEEKLTFTNLNDDLDNSMMENGQQPIVFDFDLEKTDSMATLQSAINPAWMGNN